MTTNITTTTDTTTVVVEENIVRIELNNVGVQGTPGLSGVVAVTSPITNSGSAGSAIVGINQALLSITKSQVSDFTSGTVTSASTAQQSGTAVYSVNSGTAVYATTSGTAVSISGSITKSQVSDFTSGTVTSASTAQQSGTAVYATTSGTADFATNASTAVNVSGSAITRSQVSDFTSGTVASAGFATTAGTATYATTSGTAVFATTSGTAVFATNSGTAVNISGTVTQSQVTNLTSDLALKAPLASPTFSGTVTFPFTNSGIVHSGTAGVMQVSAAAPGLGYIPYTAPVTGLYSWLDLNVVARDDQANAFTVGGHTITNAATAVVPLTITGVANQSTDLIRVQNSAAVNLFAVSQTGLITAKVVANAANQSRGLLLSNTSDTWQSGLYLNSNASGFPRLALLAPTGGLGEAVSIDSAAKVGIGNVAPVAQLDVYSQAAARVGQVVRGAASQSANLQEWQNSAGTVLSRIDLNGSISVPFLGSQVAGASYLQTNADTQSISIFAGAAATKGLVVRGFASQSANLQEWQNSAGTVLSRIDSAGGAFLAGNLNMTGTNSYVNVSGTNLLTLNSQPQVNFFNTSTGTATNGGGQKVIHIGNAAVVPSSNPSGGGILYVESGALKYRGSSGTITTLGAA